MIEDLAFLRRAQGATEQRMRDTCTVTRLSLPDGPLDPDTWLPAKGAAALVYAGPCRLHTMGRTSKSNQVQVAADLVATSAPVLSIPVSAPRVLVGDVVVITGVPVDDPSRGLRLGCRFRVVGIVFGTDMSAQRLTVETVTG